MKNILTDIDALLSKFENFSNPYGLEVANMRSKIAAELEYFDDKENNPYWYWPQCDVDECEGVSCNNGTYWRETGYWCLCSKHSAMGREGLPQPKMKDSSIENESKRDPITGYLTQS